MMDDDFDVWLGHMGKERPLRHDLRRAVNQAGGNGARKAGARGRFTGSRIGRGSTIAAVLGNAGRFSNPRARRVIVKARFVKLAGKGAKAATAHLRYLQREGTTREGERGDLYGPDRDEVDGKAFLERGAGDRHQFRFIVSAEDGAQYPDLKPLTRDLMKDVEKDLGTRLDWVAVDHFNTGHPHTHIVVRGVDERGHNLIIARDYIRHGIAGRASDIFNRDLGPRTEHEIAQGNAREVSQERFTGIDRRLLRDRDENGMASAWHRDPAEQALRAARLGTLQRMGLAHEEGKGRYRLEEGLEASLRTMGTRHDIIATMHRELKATPQVLAHDYAIYEPGKGQELLGRIQARGLSDEIRDRHYLIVEATDGRSHYVDLGHDLADGAMTGRLVEIAPSRHGLRASDKTIMEVAEANGGRYSIAAHQAHDPGATRTFAEAHVRRLEAIRKATRKLERASDGSWAIGRDHTALVEGYEQARGQRRPVQVSVVTERDLTSLAHHDGPTWLDRKCLEPGRLQLEGKIGVEIRDALARRQQWLIEQDLARQEGEAMVYKPDLIASLKQRELTRVAGQLAKELGLDYSQSKGGYLEGVYKQPVQIGEDKFAVVARSRDFTLVPWQPVLERERGRFVSGIQRGDAISWTIGKGRDRGPEIGM
ncbi:relaxase/mobilization nuclease and DUF3363 domain-containing protein [Novosphingobium profundi]|nr:relaxase/mobilization nuclease and DUF3363 domain-containing protein [Novosphingobium profundi]